jgi:hypothetical protein
MVATMVAVATEAVSTAVVVTEAAVTVVAAMAAAATARDDGFAAGMPLAMSVADVAVEAKGAVLADERASAATQLDTRQTACAMKRAFASATRARAVAAR